MREYPWEMYLNLEHHDHLLARITVNTNESHQLFDAQMDLVWREGQKIYRHIGHLYRLGSFEEARDLARQELRFFLQDQKNYS